MFLLAEKIADEPAIDAFLSHACTILGAHSENAATSSFDCLKAQMEETARRNPFEYRSLMKTVSRLEALRVVLRRESALPLLASRFGMKVVTMSGAPVLHVSGTRVSVTDAGTDVAWHQDWPNTGGSLNSVVVWIPLGGVTASTGGLTLARGEAFDLCDYDIIPPVCRIKPHISEQFDPVYVAPSYGNGIIFDQFHPHRSVASEETRLAVSFRFEDAACSDWRERGYEYLHQKVLEPREFAEWTG